MLHASTIKPVNLSIFKDVTSKKHPDISVVDFHKVGGRIKLIETNPDHSPTGRTALFEITNVLNCGLYSLWLKPLA